jgi:hypothetical protein
LRQRGVELKLRRKLPASTLGWVWLATGLSAFVVVAVHLRRVLWPLLAHSRGMGRHEWDHAEATRYLVVKSLQRFHQFPYWNPYACGGHPAWAGSDGDPNVVSPVLPLYLALPLQAATHIEIVVFAILSAAGAWVLASRFTRSHAARALVAVVFAANGRLSMQVAAGDLWFLVYAMMPWALFFFDRAVAAEPSLGPRRPRDLVWTGACLAMMLYAGGGSPLLQTGVVLGAYALWLAAAARSWAPLGGLGLSGAVAIGLAAPKLVPMLDVLRRFPQHIDSTERANPTALQQALIEPTQVLGSSIEGIDHDRWHDYGIYLGSVAVALLVLGLLLARGRREQPMRLLAVIFIGLSLGSFHEYAPWTLAHELPVLSWLREPASWLQPAVLLSACITAGAIERLLTRSGRARAALEVGLAVLVAWIAGDIAQVARRPIADELHEPGPATREQTTAFVTETKLPAALDYQPGEPVPASLSAEMANVGTIECGMFRGLDNYASMGVVIAGYDGRPTQLGAHGRGDADYHGEAFLAEGFGRATITDWSPNAVEVRVEQARPGDHVVLDQNWDPGWSVSGADAVDYQHTIAGVLREGTTTVRFRYRARGWWLGLLVWAATVSALVCLAYLKRRRPRAI